MLKRKSTLFWRQQNKRERDCKPSRIIANFFFIYSRPQLWRRTKSEHMIFKRKTAWFFVAFCEFRMKITYRRHALKLFHAHSTHSHLYIRTPFSFLSFWTFFECTRMAVKNTFSRLTNILMSHIILMFAHYVLRNTFFYCNFMLKSNITSYKYCQCQELEWTLFWIIYFISFFDLFFSFFRREQRI